MSLPYNTLTPILGEAAIDHTPESETTPEFMNGKFGELLANDKKLYEQINVLNYDRGYLSAKPIDDNVDLNTIIDNGIYEFNSYKGYTNSPSIEKYGNIIGNMVVYTGNGCTFQIIYPNYNGEDILYRKKNCSMGWGDWQQIATTTKTSFLCTAKTGYTIVRQNCFVQNNIAYINVVVKKTDETAFTVGNFDIVTNPKPPSIRTPANVLCHNMATGSGIISGGNGYITETAIATVGFVNDNVSTKSVIISGSYPIA